MQKLFKALLFIFLAIGIFSCEGNKVIKWWQSADGLKMWEEQRNILWYTIAVDSMVYDLEVFPDSVQQEILGFGGCFNEKGWDAITKLSDKYQAQIMNRLFDRKDDLRFNLCRMPIGASDYANSYYSLNDTDGDFMMMDFSIDRDRESLIPYILAAKKKNDNLQIWASPWTPPAWMKYNGHYACASGANNGLPFNAQGNEGENMLIDNDTILKAYARYLGLFVKEYKSEGIEISHLQVQNEFNSCQVFPSCTWKPELLSKFIGQYLGPWFAHNKIQTEIWLGTIERPNIAIVDSVMADSSARSYIRGMGFQWGGKGVIAQAHEKYPDLPLMQSETECGDGSNNWASAEYTFGLMKHYFEAGANAYMAWNMVLDISGKSQWGWKQNALISVDTIKKNYIVNPEYYLFKHVSHIVEPGSRKIKVSGVFGENSMAFVTPNRHLIIILNNNTDELMQISLKSGKRFINLRLPAHSFHTLYSKL